MSQATAPSLPGVSHGVIAGFLRRVGRDRLRIWGLVTGVWLAAIVDAAAVLLGRSPTNLEPHVEWWMLAGGFYLAEVLVVHIQFRRDAHTLSMSEAPFVIGLLFASPAALLAGLVIGSAAALVINRRQRAVKLLYNAGQLAVQFAIASWVFRSIAADVIGLDMRTMAAALAAMLAALYAGHLAVLAAIRATGGHESWQETRRVLVVSSAGTVGATLLGVVAAVTLAAGSALWWVGFLCMVLLFVAYRAYVDQVRDKARIEALFEAARALHSQSGIEEVMVSAVRQALDLVKAEFAVAMLAPEEGGTAYLTVADSAGPRHVMTPLLASSYEALWRRTKGTTGRVLTGADDLAGLEEFIGEERKARDGVTAALMVGGKRLGVLLAINRVGDVSGFTGEDARVLATLGSHPSTALENRRLTETLAEVRLLKSQLESLLESKDRLVAVVSHELRTPLTGIIGLTSVLREGGQAFDDETREMLDMVIGQGHELANIIDDLLAHARVAAGTLSLKPEQFDLVAEVAAVAATLSLEPPGNADPLGVFADPLRVRQILRNLITNARRCGGPDVRLVLGRKANTVTVAVVDNGAGVPPGSEEAILEPYRSAHDQAKQPGSVGLGLALSRSLAHLMHGDVTYSRRGQNT